MLDLSPFISALEEQGFSVISSNGDFIVTSHQVGHREVELVTRFSGNHVKEFPFQLPALFLRSRSQFGRLAHVSWPDSNDEGYLCLGSSENYSLEYERMELSLGALFEAALSLLEKVLGDENFNDQECLKEFSGHWLQASSDTRTILYLNESSADFEKLSVAHSNLKEVSRLDRATVVYGQNFGGANQDNVLVKSIKEREKKKGGTAYKITLPTLPLPPGPHDKLSDWIEFLCASQEVSFARRMRRFARQNKAKNTLLIFESTGADFTARFALSIRAREKSSLPLGAKLFDGWELEARKVESCTKDYLLPRGGAGESFVTKKVVLFGCGAVGAILAEQLVLLGLGTIELVDPEPFSLDNLYRHTLGPEYSGLAKSQALALELQNKYPFSKVSHHQSSLMTTDEIVFKDADLVILATGDVTNERAFHERLTKESLSIPTIINWLEPFGVGGHVIMSPNHGNKGCYTCAFVRRDDPEILDLVPNLSFIAVEQDKPIVRSVGSCAGEFLPYSKLDATRTATLAMRAAIETLSGRMKGAYSSSWCEPSHRGVLEENGIRYTQRFLEFKNYEVRSDLMAETCPNCGIAE